MSMAKAFITELTHEAATTRKLLEVVPEDKLDWKPHDRSMTLGRLAGHVAESPSWTGTMLSSTELDMAANEDAFKPFTPESRDALLAHFDECVQGCNEALSGASDEDLAVTWTLRHGDKVLSAMPRGALVRSFVLNHLIHHRGQLTVYLRLLDVPLPNVYGPTADAPDFG